MSNKIHLASEAGGRSRCRYSSRPSRRVVIKPLEAFLRLPAAVRCSECDRAAQALSDGASGRCGYCGRDMLSGSECTSSSAASACAMYAEFAATRKADPGVPAADDPFDTPAEIAKAAEVRVGFLRSGKDPARRQQACDDLAGYIRRLEAKAASGVQGDGEEAQSKPGTVSLATWNTRDAVKIMDEAASGVAPSPEGFGKVDLIVPPGERRTAKVTRRDGVPASDGEPSSHHTPTEDPPCE